ncbi:MAG: PilN domain-containing protein [Gemmatimonadetes bacterium]|nr:PilN domain-containing protein [Gemmatimonadota bacterium]
MKIEINLLPGARKKASGARLSLPDFSQIVARVKDPLLVGALAAWVVGLSVMGWMWYTQTSALSAMEPRLLEAQNEARRFGQIIAQKERQTVLRDSLVMELDAIREIDGDRFVWPHIMEEVTKALPEFTWIVALDAVTVQDQVLEDGTIIPAPVQFTIDGRTSNIQSYTRFMTRLQDSPWFRNVGSTGTNTVVENGRTVRAFQITGTYQVADSAFIRTLSVTEMFIEGG